MNSVTAVLLYPGCVFFEIALAMELVAPISAIRVFTRDGSPHRASNGTLIHTDGSYAELEHIEVACMLVPGGDPDSILLPANLVAHGLRTAYDQGAVMAGICAGSLILASAGLLKGMRATHNYTQEFAPPEVVALTKHFWDGITYEYADVVVDRQVITALPTAYRRFAEIVRDELTTKLRRRP